MLLNDFPFIQGPSEFLFNKTDAKFSTQLALLFVTALQFQQP